ncbi:MAG: type II toxin-antitoxin system VapC family toxin [Bacteroidota bacterium]
MGNKKIFIDTNILIDLLSRREPFYDEAAVLFSLADRKKIKIALSALTIANTSYVLSRHMDTVKTKSILRKVKLIVTVPPMNDRIIDLALNDESFVDFEDALQYFSALDNGYELIITRNLKDFKHSKLPVMTAREFIMSIK